MPKRVLSCDSGGIKGVLTLCFLERFEQETGKSSHDLFDLFAGTSTGAIIAGSLAKGYSATEVIGMYEEMASHIFSKKLQAWWKPWTYITKTKYSSEPMQETLKGYFGDTNIFEPTFKKKIVLFAKDLTTSRNVFFNNNNVYCPDDYSKYVETNWDTHGTLYKIVVASAVAPTFFPPYGPFVDGGVGVFGNPVYQAALEALYYYRWKDIEVYSVGTGLFNNKISSERVKKLNLFDWIRYIIGEALQDSQEQQTAIVAAMQDIKLRRYNIDFPSEIKISMDAYHRIPYLIEMGREFVKEASFYSDMVRNIFPKKVE